MQLSADIRPMSQHDIDTVFNGLAGHDIQKPRDYIERCWKENQSEERATYLAFFEGEFAGWGHIVFASQYVYFLENNITEIQNFDVIPPLRKRGIGSLLLDVLEEQAFAKSDQIGIGVGLYASYGTAQRLYVKRGYVPDGRGIMYDNQPVEPGTQIPVDDDLTMFLVKSKS